MKMKHRALAVLLSMVMVLTFMPSLAFASLEDGKYWTVSAANPEVELDEYGAMLEVEYEYGEGYDEGDAPELSFSWYFEDELIGGETFSELDVEQPGNYRCDVTDGTETKTVEFVVNPYDDSGSGDPEGNGEGSTALPDDTASDWSAVLTMSHNDQKQAFMTVHVYDDEGDDLTPDSYQWYQYDENNGAYIELTGETAAKLTVPDYCKDYSCVIVSNGETYTCSAYAESWWIVGHNDGEVYETYYN